MDSGTKIILGLLGLGVVAYSLKDKTSQASSLGSWGVPMRDGSGGGVRRNYGRGCKSC